MKDTLMAGRTTTATESPRTAGQLEVRWVPVTDASGRTHMEACWITAEPKARMVAAA